MHATRETSSLLLSVCVCVLTHYCCRQNEQKDLAPSALGEMVQKFLCPFPRQAQRILTDCTSAGWRCVMLCFNQSSEVMPPSVLECLRAQGPDSPCGSQKDDREKGRIAAPPDGLKMCASRGVSLRTGQRTSSCPCPRPRSGAAGPALSALTESDTHRGTQAHQDASSFSSPPPHG